MIYSFVIKLEKVSRKRSFFLLKSLKLFLIITIIFLLKPIENIYFIDNIGSISKDDIDIINEIRIRKEKNERVLITTLTIRMSEELTNYLKELTFDFIPSDFKSILLASLNPFYHVSISRNEIYVNVFNRFKQRIQLTKDCLIEHYVMETEFDGTIAFSASYNYVQDHFDKEIIPPVEAYKDKLVNKEDIK